MASRRGTAPPSPCPASSFLVNPPSSPWVSLGRPGPSITNATQSSASAILSSSRLEREHYLRQNRDISRLCSLKSAQIRQFEAKLSKLERENLGMRIALREAENGLQVRSRAQSASLSSSSSTSANFSDLQDADTLGKAKVVVPKPGQGREANDVDLPEDTYGHESAEDDGSDSNEDTHRRTGVESLGDHSLKPRGSSPQHSQHPQQREPNPDGGALQASYDSPQTRQHRHRSSGSISRGILKHSPRLSSSSASPSPFFEPKRYLRRETRRAKVRQKPRSPGARSTDSFSSSIKPSGPTAETTLPSSEKTTQDLDDSEDIQVVVPRVPRPSGPTRNAFSMNYLHGIAENGPLELSKTISGTGENFTFLRSRLSVSTEYLGSTAPPDVTMVEPESDRSDQSSVKDSIARKLKPRPSSPDVQTAQLKEGGLYKHRAEKTRRLGDAWATQDPGSERAKSIALSEALLVKFSKPAAPRDGSCDMNAPERPQVASMKAAATTKSRDLDDCGGIADANSSLQDGGGSDLQGADAQWEALSNEGDASKAGTTIASPRQSGVSRRPIIARRRRLLRATPSPLVKSRSAIKAQHLKAMTPAQLLRRMNKSLLGTSKTPALPKSITRNAAYSGIYSTNTPSVFSGPPPSTQASSTSVDSAQKEQDNGSDESTESATKLMPPPPALASNSSRKHRSKAISTVGPSIKVSSSTSPADGSGEKESMTVGNTYDGQEVTEQANIYEDLEGTSSRPSSKRVGAPAVAYKLPSLRE
ncbi:hypothetical protein BGZ70_003153 [Mortierella alpina]|uniref:Uncharacterized protein n=1 Tax=Mortierella alpina TaxID=64518 RepID=A0A9P6JBC7_MORAP|nr:hypothetical protein BGZ70_003153 [Mortierella alpina]